MYKVTIVGLGNMGKVHIDAYKKINNVKIVAVIDKNTDVGQKKANELQCQFFDSMESLKKSGIDIDIVDICVPTSFHLKTIEESAEICKSIICEKPICIGYDNVLKLKKIVEDNKLNLMIAHVLRFWDGYIEIKDRIDKGEIKNINSVVCYRRQKVPKWSKDSWLFNVNISGGIIYDLLIHDIDYVVWLFGKPKKVLATVAAYENDVQRHAKLELIYENGFTASIFGSWGMPENYVEGQVGFSCEVIGEKTMISFDSVDGLKYLNGEVKNRAKYESDPYYYELKYFLHCLEKGKAPTVADIYAVSDSILVAEAAVYSAKANEIVSVN